VVAGLVEPPVIAVPTSVGYGAHFGGLAPLLAMLNSCATGIAVVNIDNGFGAGYFAHLINQAIGGSRQAGEPRGLQPGDEIGFKGGSVAGADPGPRAPGTGPRRSPLRGQDAAPPPRVYREQTPMNGAAERTEDRASGSTDLTSSEGTRTGSATLGPIDGGSSGRELHPSELPSTASRPSPSDVTVLEANLDDMNPQIYDHVMDCLFEAGALDVTLTPIQMKKNRPAVTLSVICEPARVEAMAEVLFAETSTLGLRMSRWERLCLEREWVQAETPWGSVRVKIGRRNGRVLTRTPEYEDCKRVAQEAGVPLKQVQAAALAAVTTVESTEGGER
jgi:hypothetical protein